MKSRNTGPTGIDINQLRAREAAGMETRLPKPKVRLKMVEGLVAVTCDKCGCTNAWPSDAKRAQKVCVFCGHQEKLGWQPKSNEDYTNE